MKNNIIVVGIVTLIIGLLIGFALGRGTSGHMGHNMMTNQDRGHISERDMDAAHGHMTSGAQSDSGSMTGKGMDHGAMMVESEKQFLAGMIPHHEEAVASAQLVLKRGATTPEVKALAEAIISSQKKEIADMKTWYQTWYQTPYESDAKYQPMMRGDSSLEGQALDKAFLEDMIKHHMGAIMMAESVQAHIEHDEIKILSDNIIKSQSAEIRQMQEILRSF